MPRRKVRGSQKPPHPPATSDDKEHGTVVMFADIMGASEISNHKRPQEYAHFVREFQELFKQVCAKYAKAWHTKDFKGCEYPVRGDEGLLMIYRPGARADLSADVDLAINVALDLKRLWLCSQENQTRIKSGLLPINLGIGIHAGTTYLAECGPEGYAVNLAKRVESHSRQGKFSHILVSEAAHGHLNHLSDEVTYLFDDPQTISPKGISRDIRVYEVKHHFLPSDWTGESAAREQSKSLLNPKAVDVEVIASALRINPTNLWLAEEFIRSSMLHEYHKLTAEEQDKEECLRKAFEPSKQQVELLAQSAQRHAGVLFIQGLIEGECYDYQDERDRYDDAIRFSDQLAQAYWYRGLSYSFQLWDAIDEDVDRPHSELSDDQKKLGDKAIDDLRQARRRRPQCAWIRYDYGWELTRWERCEAEKVDGIDNITLAASALDAVLERVKKDPCLRKVHDHPRIAQLIRKKSE